MHSAGEDELLCVCLDPAGWKLQQCRDEGLQWLLTWPPSGEPTGDTEEHTRVLSESRTTEYTAEKDATLETLHTLAKGAWTWTHTLAHAHTRSHRLTHFSTELLYCKAVIILQDS